MTNDNPITMKDMAKVLGISVATVSRALKDSPMISEEVRERVKAYAREHNFRPNILASHLRLANPPHVKIIGVIVPELVHYYFSTVLAGIEEEASRRGYMYVIAQSNEDYEREVRICQRFFETRACGVIVSQTKNTHQYDHFKHLQDAGIPLVFFDRICTGIDASRVVVDDYNGTLNAVRHLISKGRKRIAFYGSSTTLEIAKNRYNGYIDALRQAHLTTDKQLTIECDSAEMAERITMHFVNTLHPDAIFCINDMAAVAAVNTQKKNGIRVPEDIDVACFTDSSITRFCDPPLTVVDQRGREVGRNAADILISQVEGTLPIDKPAKRIVKTKLIIR